MSVRYKGTYLFIFYLDKDKEIQIGKLGRIKFNEGFYVYVGSAKNSLISRVNRHIKTNKKMRWHIDYLSIYYKPIMIIFFTKKYSEENLAYYFLNNGVRYIKNFGSSDSKYKSHLFYFKNLCDIIDLIKKL